MAVKVSGPVLASLFFEQSNADSDREGFLLGQIQSHVTDIVTDSQISGIKEETITYVHSFVPCASTFSWYTNTGSVVADKLKAILKGKHQEVVGWYKLRRNSPPGVVSMREKLVHHHLLSEFPSVNPKNFLYFLSTPSTSSNGSTHTFDHMFMTISGKNFVGTAVSIINLGDTAPSQYRHHPSTTISMDHGNFAQTVRSFQDQFCDESGRMHSVTGVQTFNSVIHQQLMDLCSTVATSEQQLSSLQADVDRLQLKLKQQQPVAAVPSEDQTPSQLLHKQSSPPLLLHKQSSPPPRRLRNQQSPPALFSGEPSPPISDTNMVDDLIVLDDNVHEVPTVNAAIVQDLSPKIVQKPKSNVVVEHEEEPPPSPAHSPPKAMIIPKQSSLEPTLSKSLRQSPSKSQTTTRGKKKKEDTFSFVDDLLTEHKTFQEVTKSNTKWPNSTEKSKNSRLRGATQKNDGTLETQGSSEGQCMTRSRKKQPVVETSSKNNIINQSDESMEISSSPTF